MEIQNDSVVFYRDAEQKWRWRRSDAGNNKIIGASSEAFENFKDCYANFTMNLCSNYDIDIDLGDAT